MSRVSKKRLLEILKGEEDDHPSQLFNPEFGIGFQSQ